MFPKCYYIADGEPVGPISSDELFSLASDGTIAHETLVWMEGSAHDWQPFATWSATFEEESANVIASEPTDFAPPTSSAALAPGHGSLAPSSLAEAVESSGDRGSVAPSASTTEPEGTRFYRNLATYAWASILISIGAKLFLDAVLSEQPAIHFRAIIISTSCWLLTGIVSAVIALTAVRRYGRKGILVPALIGIGVWLIPPALAVPQFLALRKQAQARAASRITLQSLITDPTATRIVGKEPDFSVDIPKEFFKLDQNETPADTLYAFAKPSGTADLKDVIMVGILPGVIAPGGMDPKEVPKGITLTSHSWRGVPVEGFRAELEQDGIAYVVIQVQVPLRPRAIQLGFATPQAKEADLPPLIQKVLASLDGESNW
jgi:hypothetical protein